MIRVITYGTYDCLHYGHVCLLEKARALGDFLIVGVTSEDFDVNRGKINVKQSLTERIEAVRQTGLADQIIVEEYQGQKIDDIQRYDIDIFTVGSDWNGYFDYLNKYCQVVYLPRTNGISSTELRAEEMRLRIGIVGGPNSVAEKFIREGNFVNGLEIKGLYSEKITGLPLYLQNLDLITDNYDDLLNKVEAVYICTSPSSHYTLIKKALKCGKHVICESPLVLDRVKCKELFLLAEQKKLVFMESLKTAYSLAFSRMIVLIKSGLIGDVVSVDASCTSLAHDTDKICDGSLFGWSPQALLVIYKILGTQYKKKTIKTMIYKSNKVDLFTKIDFIYPNAVASLKVGNGVKSEGELVISGTKGYIYVPAPWWKTDYFEARYEDPRDNKKFFYQLKGEGIRNMIVRFVQAVSSKSNKSNISQNISESIAEIMDDFLHGIDTIEIGDR